MLGTSLAILVAAYLVGSIPSGLIIVKIANGKDVRKVASGRTGGTNAMRAAGWLAGLFTALADIFKGVASYWIANLLVPGNSWLQVGAALMAIIGHNYSIFLLEKGEDGKLHLRGGAGGATCLGGSIALWNPAALIILPLSLAIYLVVGYASLTTISVAFFSILLFAYRAWMGYSPWIYVIYGVVALFLLLWALRPNLVRLKNGNERIHGLRPYLARRREQKKSGQPTARREDKTIKIKIKPERSNIRTL